MSYLDAPRLHFAGRFVAATATVNNDLANFDPAKPPQTIDPSWNPGGLGSFKLLDCVITAYVDRNYRPAADPVVGARLEDQRFTQNADARGTVAKMVDLDPDQQTMPRVFGLNMRLLMAGLGVLEGALSPPPTARDLWLTRVAGLQSDAGSSAHFQSRLTSLLWRDGDAGSDALSRLRQASPEALSVNFVTDAFAYANDPLHPRFATGRIVGTIGPAHAGEPATIVAARRLLPTGAKSQFWPAPCQINPAGTKLTIDLGNSIQEQAPEGEPVNVGQLHAVIQTPQPIELGAIDYSRASYMKTAGVVDLDLSAEQARAAAGAPIALVSAVSTIPVLKEAADGIYVDVDECSLRLNPKETGAVDLYARRFGRPLAGYVIPFTYMPGPVFSDNNQKYANTPPSALPLPPPATTDAKGRATITLTAGQPVPLPPQRIHVDSQLFFIGGPWQDTSGSFTIAGGAISVVVYSSGPTIAVDQPTWSDVAPVFRAYARLYPGMNDIVSLTNYETLKEHAGILQRVLSADFEDPRYMPVTRDMPNYKRQMLLTWLRNGCPR